MEKCPNTHDTLTRYLEGGLTESEQQSLQDHLKSCSACASALEELALVSEVVKDALVPPDGAHQAAARITEQLSRPQTLPAHRTIPFLGKRIPIRQWVAGAALLLIGTGLGFVLQGYRSSSNITTGSRPPLAIEVTELKGTVLVKARDAQIWQVLQTDSPIHLGDTFHTTATSRLVLGLDKDSQLKITQNSLLTLESYDEKLTEFYLEHGQCTPVLNGPHGPFFISTPNGRMEALGTEFTVKVTE